MTALHRTVAATAAVAALAAPAAAQAPSWQQQLERQMTALSRTLDQLPPGPRPPREAREPRNVPEASEPFQQTASIGRNGTLTLENLNGDIRVTGGGGGGDVRITATRRVRHAREEERQALLRELQVRVLERGGDVEVRTEFPRRRGGFAAVDFVVAVPDNANVTLKTMTGSVRVANIDGEVRLESLSGDLQATNVRRLRGLKSFSGNLEVADSEAEELSAETVSGDITVRNLRGRSLDLRSVSGDVRLADVDFQRAVLRTTAGDLEYAGRLARSGRYELQTHAGDIRVAPTGNQGFDLEAATFAGDVRSDFALTLISGGEPGARRGPGRALRGTFGDAAAVITARSFSGDVIIVKR